MSCDFMLVSFGVWSDGLTGRYVMFDFSPDEVEALLRYGKSLFGSGCVVHLNQPAKSLQRIEELDRAPCGYGDESRAGVFAPGRVPLSRSNLKLRGVNRTARRVAKVKGPSC